MSSGRGEPTSSGQSQSKYQKKMRVPGFTVLYGFLVYLLTRMFRSGRSGRPGSSAEPTVEVNLHLNPPPTCLLKVRRTPSLRLSSPSSPSFAFTSLDPRGHSSASVPSFRGPLLSSRVLRRRTRPRHTPWSGRPSPGYDRQREEGFRVGPTPVPVYDRHPPRSTPLSERASGTQDSPRRGPSVPFRERGRRRGLRPDLVPSVLSCRTVSTSVAVLLSAGLLGFTWIFGKLR